MDMMHDKMHRDGNVNILPLFGDTDVRTPRYTMTFSYRDGLLFATWLARCSVYRTRRHGQSCL